MDLLDAAFAVVKKFYNNNRRFVIYSNTMLRKETLEGILSELITNFNPFVEVCGNGKFWYLPRDM